jgi:hypothetical protein
MSEERRNEMAGMETKSFLDEVRAESFGSDGELVVVHHQSVEFAVRVVARQWYGVDVDPEAARALVAEHEMEDCAVELVRHTAWPDEDGDDGECWMILNPDHGPTGERKPGVMFNEDDQWLISDAFEPARWRS